MDFINFSCKIKNVLPNLISSNQTAYIKNRFISETGRLISDILELCNALNIDGFLETVAIERALDSINHSFFILV